MEPLVVVRVGPGYVYASRPGLTASTAAHVLCSARRTSLLLYFLIILLFPSVGLSLLVSARFASLMAAGVWLKLFCRVYLKMDIVRLSGSRHENNCLETPLHLCF